MLQSCLDDWPSLFGWLLSESMLNTCSGAVWRPHERKKLIESSQLCWSGWPKCWNWTAAVNLLNFVVYKLFCKPSGTRMAPQFTKPVAEVFRLSSKCEILLSNYQILKAFLSGLKRDSQVREVLTETYCWLFFPHDVFILVTFGSPIKSLTIPKNPTITEENHH